MSGSPERKDRSISVYFAKEGMTTAEKIELVGKKIGHRIDDKGRYNVFADNKTVIVKDENFLALMLDTDPAEIDLK